MSDWPSVRLADCADIVSGATPSTSESAYWDGDIYWATPKDLSDLEGAYISDTPRKITRRGLESCAATILPPESVLFSSRAPIGHVAINTVPMATNQGFKSFVPDRGRLSSKFLYHWLRRNRPYLESLGNGATFKEVSKAVVARIEIPLPPLPEQRRIAEILDKADALRAKRRAALAQLDTLTQSIFLDMFGDPATNPKGWPVVELASVATTTSGGTPNREVAEYFGGGIPWVKSGELHQGVVTRTEESLTERGLAESSAKLVPAGTVLVAMYGATVGAVAVLGIEAATNQAICCVTPTRELNASYFVELLRWHTPSLLAKRVGGAQPNLSQDLLRRLRLLLPPLERQQAFALCVSRAADVATDYRESLNGLDTLFASLQHRAFRGEL